MEAVNHLSWRDMLKADSRVVNDEIISQLVKLAGPPVVDSNSCSSFPVRLTRNGAQPTTTSLTPLEAGMLFVLAENAGNPIRKWDILKRVWQDPRKSTSVVESAVYRLRQKLGDDLRQPGIILNEPGKGYALSSAVQVAFEPTPIK